MCRWLALSLMCTLPLLASCKDSSPAGPSQEASLLADRGTADSAAATRDQRAVSDLVAPSDGNPCPRLPAPADRVRKVVVAHPFGGAGLKVGAFEVLSLSLDGKLSSTGETFQLATSATHVPIHFTPDAKLGLVVLDDGTIGVFRLDGAVQVVHPAFKPSFYASSLAIDPAGERVYALSWAWREHGGGVYSLRIQCDGTLVEEGLLAASKLPAALELLATQGTQGSSRAVLVASDVLDSPAGDDVHLIDLATTPARIAGASAFGDNTTIVSAAALTADEHYLLVADNATLSATAGNRVAVVEVQPGKLRAAQILSPLKDPMDVIASPWNDTALVLGFEANAITIVDYHPADPSAPFTVRGLLATSNKVTLPSVGAPIRRGSLAGRVIIAELTALRQVQFEKGGTVKEVEFFSFGSGVAAMAGALGVAD